ncbi:MAG: low-specificity L-threonine aldolase [Chloroflexaceae bacterium]|nr:low-specificity L-threonine aldolase [Chloroflexaceae bacterium]NJO04155.1 low-specificity L-threonine aldolase [Chloroflexaceae bacterium]
MIDLRSDTVTLPTPAMREAIARAELGDDVYGEDPTINRMQALAAEKVGKEAALLVPTGTMGNLSAMLAHCGRGDQVIVGSECHIYQYEAGGASVLGGLMYKVVPNLPDGTLESGALHAVLANYHYDSHVARLGLLCLENTHNRCGGAVLSPEYMAEMRSLAQQHDLPVHLDGARVFNAAVALGVDVRELTQHVDSVQFCLSKGLAAPVGSVIAGSRAFITQAHRMRKILGGGMRQAGIIAAAGIVALTEMVDRLAEDHLHAAMLAEGLATTPGIVLDVTTVQTDIVIFALSEGLQQRMNATQFVRALHAAGVLMGEMGGGRIRAVTHYGIAADDIQETLAAVRRVVA